MSSGVAPLLIFSHGNSFPAGTYEPMLARWRQAGLNVQAVPRYGHDPRHPVTSNWPHLRDQLIECIEQSQAAHGQREPVWLVGHSLGGLLSLMAACRKPRLVRGIVLLDSPVVVGWRAHSLHMAKLSGLIRRVSPGRASQRRRQHWPDREAVRSHFAGKTAFARWDPAALEAYVQAGFVERNGRVELAFDREIETRIYNTLPHNLESMLRRHPLQCPMGFIAGTQSVEMRQGGSQAAHRLAGPYFQHIEGSHLFPLERPAETAQRVLDLLQVMERSGLRA